jgi:hypothetical protein
VPPGEHQVTRRIDSAVVLEGSPGAVLLGPVHITAAATLQDLEIRLPVVNDGRAALHVTAKGARVLRCTVAGGALIEGAETQLSESTLTGAGKGGRACVELSGATDCQLCDNAMRAHDGAGVLAHRRARARLVGNRIEGSGGCGIEVRGADVLAEGNSVLGAGKCGVLVHGGGQAQLVGNELRRYASSGVEVSGAGSRAELRGNTLADGVGGVGLLCWRGGEMRAADNDVSGCAIAGVEVGEGSAPTVEANRIRRCAVGVLVSAGGGGELRANQIEGASLAGVECRSAAAGLSGRDNAIRACRVGLLVQARR